MTPDTASKASSTALNGYRVSVDETAEDEWNALLPLFDDASIYQTWAYGAVRWGEKQLSHLVLRKNAAVVGMAQVRVIRVPLIGSGIAYIRWGPLYRLRGSISHGEALVALMEAIREEYANRRGLMVRILPNIFQGSTCAADFARICQEAGFAADEAHPSYRTLLVSLEETLEQIRKRLDQKWRNQLNASERNGLSIEEGQSDELYARFLTIYDEMMGRKRFETTVDARQFGRLQRSLPADLKMHILLCEKDGKDQAGLVSTSVGDTGIYLLGATSEAGMKSKGAYLLQWQMIKRLKERGCRWYDLGGINPETNPGVYHFKAGLGGVESRQCSRRELSGSWISSACVMLPERLSGAIEAWRHRRKPALLNATK